MINVHSSILKSLINVVATIPQLLSNPESAIASLFGQATGTSSGLMNQLQQSPIEIIAAQGTPPADKSICNKPLCKARRLKLMPKAGSPWRRC